MSLKNRVLRRRGLGCHPDPLDARDYPVERLGIALGDELPDSVSLRGRVQGVLDQRSTNSCVAHAFAGAVGILERRAGLTYQPISRLFLYWNARRLHGGQRRDAGTYIRAAAKALVRFGVPDEALWPFAVGGDVNRQPGWGAYMRAFGRHGGEYARILGYGNERVQEVCAVLAAGYPVVFGAPVDRAFTRDEGPDVIGRPIGGDIVGGHAMLIIGYDRTPDGHRFEVLNSWGPGWRDGGFARLTEGYLRWTAVHDLTIIKGWDRIRT